MQARLSLTGSSRSELIQVSAPFHSFGLPDCSLFFGFHSDARRLNRIEPGGTAGYTATGAISGISHLHVSGTGGGNSYQVISILPIGLHKIPHPDSGFV